jgi:hypothetical protein
MPRHPQTHEDYKTAGDPSLEVKLLLASRGPGLHGKEKVYGSIP